MLKTKYLTLALISISLIGGLALSQCGKSEESTDGSNTETAASGNSADIDAGKQLFTQNGCVTCHGESGMGDGPAGKGLNVRNLTDASTYKQGSTAAEITTTIETGIPGTAMAAYAHIPEADRQKLAAFIVSLQK
ncbi:MAG: c-type cytochrome [Leptospiraceae bacterium]|nr:c-type cytochrome [Leptospiraceae bacterium]